MMNKNRGSTVSYLRIISFFPQFLAPSSYRVPPHLTLCNSPPSRVSLVQKKNPLWSMLSPTLQSVSHPKEKPPLIHAITHPTVHRSAGIGSSTTTSGQPCFWPVVHAAGSPPPLLPPKENAQEGSPWPSPGPSPKTGSTGANKFFENKN